MNAMKENNIESVKDVVLCFFFVGSLVVFGLFSSSIAAATEDSESGLFWVVLGCA